jgi:regulatory protein
MQRARAGATGLSLKGRALRLLSQREHSRLELARKLAPHAPEPEALEVLLNELERDRWLSEERFAHSVAHRRSERYGVRRIELELNAHGLKPAAAADVLSALRLSERERAYALWAKRFGVLPPSTAERAKQQRFLMQRGFSGDTLSWILRSAQEQGLSLALDVDRCADESVSAERLI